MRYFWKYILVFCGLLLFNTVIAFAAPSAEAYEELLISLPPVGQSVTTIPDYAERIPPQGDLMMIKGNYNGIAFVERVERNGIVSMLNLSPQNGEENTSDIQGRIVAAMNAVYGEATSTGDGNYVWTKNGLTGAYTTQSGMIFMQSSFRR